MINQSTARRFPFSPVEGLDLSPVYDELRPSEPVTPVIAPHGEGRAWLSIGFQETRDVYMNPRLSREAASQFDVPRSIPFRHTVDSIVSVDGPRHKRLRSLATQALSLPRIEALRPRIREISEELLDQIEQSKSPVDLVPTLFSQLPVKVICELLGVPEEHSEYFKTLTERRFAIGDEDKVEDSQVAQKELEGYIRDLIAKRQDSKNDQDLIGALAHAREADGDRLSEQEMVTLVVSFLVGGHETTVSFLGKCVFLLLSHPEQLKILIKDMSLLPDAIEECLRFAPLNKGPLLPRVAMEDIEFHGVRVLTGDTLLPDVAAANRDPKMFEQPNDFDILREKKQHLTFGFGKHQCVGAALARAELQEALEALITRFPTLQLAGLPSEVLWNEQSASRQPLGLEVTW